jgi:hypothetical protein
MRGEREGGSEWSRLAVVFKEVANTNLITVADLARLIAAVA